ncbi:MAG: hypothetical protein ACI4V6_00695 [Dorea sp.]
MKKSYKGLTVNKILALAGCILMFISQYVTLVSHAGESRNMLEAMEDMAGLAQGIIVIGCLLILVFQFLGHPRISVLGVLLEAVMIWFLIMCFANVSEYTYRMGPGFWVLLVGWLVTLVDVFLPPYPFSSGQNKN